MTTLLKSIIIRGKENLSTNENIKQELMYEIDNNKLKTLDKLIKNNTNFLIVIL